jgi:Zn-dependent peptidase ImmA (M78 family)
MARLSETILGECCRRQRRFVIRLNDQMGENQAIDVLLHEWGHALAWNHLLDRLAKSPDTSPEEFEQASHDEAWGCAYARVWRAYLAAGR